MARRTGTTNHTVAELQAGTGIDAQLNDKVLITDLGAFGRLLVFVNDTSTADDGAYTLAETGQTGRWRAEQATSLVSANLNVPFTALLDNTEEEISVSVTGIVAGRAYVMGVVSGLPAGTSLELEENHAANTLNFKLENNSGATLTASNVVVNIYQV